VSTRQWAWVTVARILRPHGRRGEVACEILTDFPERLARLACVDLWDGNAQRRKSRVLSCRLSHNRGGQAIFQLEGSESISDAEALVGLEVQIPFADRAELPQGSYYVSDLIGCGVFGPGGEPVGTVRDVQFTGEDIAGTPILVLESSNGELLVPLAAEICVGIDVTAKRILIVPPAGLLDLNRDS
jgi:16S rRNA processing protein RimM